MAGRRSSKKTEAIIALNWGTPAGGKTPSSSMSRGVGHRSAARAGVTRDHYLTPMAQRLAADLEKDRIQKEREADPRSRFEKRYNIIDGVANLSVEDFLRYRAWSRTLRAEGITKINIGNGNGVNATFEFFNDEAAASPDKKDLKIIAPNTLTHNGVLSQLQAGDSVLLYTHGRSFGWLTIEATMEKKSAPQATKTKSLDDINAQNNFADLFHSRAGLRHIVEGLDAQTSLRVTKQFTNFAQEPVQSTVGYVSAIGTRDISTLPIKSFREIWMVASAQQFSNGDAVKQQVFKRAPAVLVCADNDRSEPLAILTRRP